MKLAFKLAWEHRASWFSVMILSAVSAAIFINSFHIDRAYELYAPEFSGMKIELVIALLTTFLIVQSIAALSLESQSRDLAIAKTCGASTRSLRWTLILEVVLVASAGYLIGALLSLFFRDMYVHQSVLAMIDKDVPAIGFYMNAYVSALIWLLIAVVVGAWGTIRRVSKQNIVEALQGETITSKKRPKAMRIFFGSVSLLVMVGIFILAQNMDKIMSWARSGDLPKEMVFQISGLPMMTSVMFVLMSLVFLTAVAPNLYQVMLRWIIKLFPQKINAPIQVGFNLAHFNAAKYSGSITPIIVFIAVVIMIFTAMESSVLPTMAEAKRLGIDISDMEDVNYGAITYTIGPAVVIAIVGSLCTVMISGRNRIYVNKLTGVLGADGRTRLAQGMSEALGYMSLVVIISLIIMLLTGLLAMIGNGKGSGIDIPYVVSWIPWLLAILVSMVVMSIPILYASYRAKHLDSRDILERFGQ